MYADWTKETIEWVTANKLSQAEIDSPEHTALYTVLMKMLTNRYQEPIHRARKEAQHKLELAEKCKCEDCEREAKEYKWFLEVSQPLAEKDENA